jgi:hypothetical protein
MAKKKIYKHHQRALLSDLEADLQGREGGIASTSEIIVFSTQAGTKLRVPANRVFDIKAYGAVGDNSTDDYAAIQAAINACEAAGGGVVAVPAGQYRCNSTLELPQRNIIFQGAGADTSIIRHVSSSFGDLVSVDTEGEGFVVIRDIELRGSGYLTGNTRYLISAVNFNENCLVENVQMRNSAGFIKITAGYLSAISNLRIQAGTPNPTVAGLTNLQWAEIYDDGHAPIHLKGMNACSIDGVRIYRVGSETFNSANDGSGSTLTPASIVLLENTQACTVNGLSVEGSTTFTDGSTYNVRQKSVLKLTGMAGLVLDGFYNEANYCTEHIVHCAGPSQVRIDGMTAYNMDVVSDLFRNDSVWDLCVSNSMLYRIRSPKLYKVSQSGYSTHGIVKFKNTMVSAGNIFSDTSLSSDDENVNDTYGTGAANLHGIADEDDHTSSASRLYTPKRAEGLVVTAGSNPVYDGSTATGHYVQITSGVFMNEAGELVVVKRPTGETNVSTLAVFRLRPATASRYYRVYVGVAGNLYLVESAYAFTNDLGNWIAQFRTNASTQIVRYSDGSTAGLDTDPYNPRLSLFGSYIPNQSKLLDYGTAAPTTGQFIVGDRRFNSAKTSTGPLSWVCTVAGSPGTWVAEYTSTQGIARLLSSQTTTVGNVLTGEDDLLSYTVPAATLANAGDFLRITAWGEFANNANNKQVRAYFDGHQLFATGALAFNNSSWRLDFTLSRISATTQRCTAGWVSSDTLLRGSAATTNPARTLANALIFKVTGEATANDDVIMRGLTVEYVPAP